MTEKDVIMEVIGFFIVPYKPKKDEPQYYEPIEDEQELFQKILNFRLVSEREDERQYELNDKIKRLEVLKQKMIEFEKPSFYHIAKIDRFIEFCNAKEKKQISDRELSPYERLITEHFSKMGKNGWESAFLSESDFNRYVGILTNFFECKPYDIDNLSIKLKAGSKTATASVLKDIHKDLSEVELRSNKDFFNVIRVLNHFKDENELKIYKALIR